MIKDLQVSLFDLIMSISDAVDLVSPGVTSHQKQVAYLAVNLAAALGLPEEQQTDLVLAGALHDIGALSLQERLDTLVFDLADPYRHAEIGYMILSTFQPLSRAAELVRFHHVAWESGRGKYFRGKPVPLSSHILHLADRVAVSVNREQEILGQVNDVCAKIKRKADSKFAPDVVNALESIAHRESLWLDLFSPSLAAWLSRRIKLPAFNLDLEIGMPGLARLFSKIIDFRSPFTVTHSSGVAAVARGIAQVVGFSERECLMLETAGYLHDLGKLAIPTEILEKPARLTTQEFNLIKSHTFHTYRILETGGDLQQINAWASLHHERLDGSGYPFHLTSHDLALGSQIMAVADVFTALTEDRPYRQGMDKGQVINLLKQMVDDSALSANLVKLLQLNYGELNDLRVATQSAASQEYQSIRQLISS